uniref:RNase H type-1 domain-containing protein n=1 Tax=Cannabis sativa TaxID=3483 RepID=A0A803PAP7_CANSA
MREGEMLANFLFNSGGVDLGCGGDICTWENLRNAENRVRKRLDRVIIDARWFNDFPKASIHLFPIVGSDHAPLLLNSWGVTPKLRYPFRFLEVWTSRPDCKKVIQNSWLSTEAARGDLVLQKKFSETKRELKKWNQEVFDFCDRKLNYLRRQLGYLQNVPISKDTVELEAEIQLEILELERRMDRILRQKFKDMNIAFLGKLFWMVLKDVDKIWVKIFLAKYCNNDSVWSLEKQGKDSWYWKSLLEARKVCLEGAGILIVDDDCEIWDRPWINGKDLEGIKACFHFICNHTFWKSSASFQGAKGVMGKTLEDQNSSLTEILLLEAFFGYPPHQRRGLCWWSTLEDADPQTFIAWACDTLWKWRNDLVFNDKQLDINLVYKECHLRCAEFLIDGSWRDDLDEDGFAVFHRHQNLEDSWVAVGHDEVEGVLEGELRGIALALQAGLDKNVSKVRIETDSKASALAFKVGSLLFGWNVFPIFSFCLNHCKSFDDVLVSFVPRL